VNYQSSDSIFLERGDEDWIHLDDARSIATNLEIVAMMGERQKSLQQNVTARFELVSGGSGWESNPPGTAQAAPQRF
jgi:hypothetical protein